MDRKETLTARCFDNGKHFLKFQLCYYFVFPFIFRKFYILFSQLYVGSVLAFVDSKNLSGRSGLSKIFYKNISASSPFRFRKNLQSTLQVNGKKIIPLP